MPPASSLSGTELIEVVQDGQNKSATRAQFRDVVFYLNLAAFPATGDSAVLYVDNSTNKIHRWSGSAYVEVSPSTAPATTDSLTEGTTNLYFTNARADARIAAQKGAASGIAPLDSTGKIPSANLPSYVDDVLEYTDLASFPATGTSGIIYVALNPGKIYRWSGSAYVEIAPSPGSTDSLTEGTTNLYFTNARADARITAQRGAANGIAPLDSSSKVLAANLPTTDSLTEGSTNLWFTNARADARVQNAKGSGTPAMNGTAAAGSQTTWSPFDHVHPTDTSRAPLNNPVFTGNAAALPPVIQSKATRDVTTISATAATGTINIDALTQAAVWYTISATANFVLNIRGDSVTALNSLLAVGESVSILFLNTNGATPFYLTSVQVDGTTAGTIRWIGGLAPISGNASSVDAYSVTLIKTAASTWAAFLSQTRYA